MQIARIGRAGAFTLVLLLILPALVIEAAAQSPEKFLSNAAKKLGSKKSLKRLSSVSRRGLIVRSRDGASGEFLMQTSRPDNFNVSFDLRGFEFEVGFNGRSGWARDSREGLRTLTGEEGKSLKTQALFRNWLWTEYKKQKYKITGDEGITMDGIPSRMITITNPQGVSVKMYFDAFSNLLIREETDGGPWYEYKDYRPVNEILEPFEIIAYIENEKYVIKLDQITHNQLMETGEFDFPQKAGEPLPDIPKLLDDLKANQDEIERILEDYSYKQEIVKRELTDDGDLEVKESETFQLSFYKGFRIQRLIAKNGEPLDAEEQKDADEKAQDRVREIEKEIRKQEERKVSQSSDGTPDPEGRNISIAEVLRASKLLNPRRETLKGRDVVVFDFEPDPDFDFKNAKSFLKFFGKTAGVIWIDENDRQVARIEAVLFDSYKVGGGILAKLRKGASFTLEQERVNNEIWLPTLADINLSVRVLLFGGVKVNRVIRSFDYKKFTTEVEDARVDEIKDPSQEEPE